MLDQLNATTLETDWMQIAGYGTLFITALVIAIITATVIAL